MMTSVVRIITMMTSMMAFMMMRIITVVTAVMTSVMAVVNVIYKQRLLNGISGLLHVWLLDHLWLLLVRIVPWLLHSHWLRLGISNTRVSLHRCTHLESFICSERLSKFLVHS